MQQADPLQPLCVAVQLMFTTMFPACVDVCVCTHVLFLGLLFLTSLNQIHGCAQSFCMGCTGTTQCAEVGTCFSVGLLCDLLWADPDKETMGWGENDRGVSFTFGPEIVSKFLAKHDLDLICRAHQVRVEHAWALVCM